MDEPASIGKRLRQRREERGLSMEEATLQSKVPIRLLQALESDDYHLLPDPLYLVRSLHEYARLLDLDPAALEGDFRAAIRRPARVPVAPTPIAMTPRSVPWKQIAWTLGAIAVVTPLIFIALSLASKRATERPAPPVARPTEEQSTAVGPASPGEAAPAGAGGPSDGTGSAGVRSTAELRPPTGPGPAPAPATPGAAPSSSPAGVAPGGSRAQVLVVKAQELTWMVIRSDGAEPREALLQAGETARFTADTKFTVTLGNAGGVALTLNGTPVPIQGQSGQVIRDLVLPASASAAGGAESSARPAGSAER